MPVITSTLVRTPFIEVLRASGIKCIKASPSKAPTAILINRKIYFRRTSSLKESEKIPINEIRLTIITLVNVYRYIVVIKINLFCAG